MTQIRLLVNATTITVGGGVQAAISFVEYAAGLGASAPAFLFAISPSVYDGLAAHLRNDSRLRLFEGSPAHPLKGRGIRQALLDLEKEFAPDLIYSIGFPSYVVFRTAEAGRYTNGWEICSFTVAMGLLPQRERILRSLKSNYRLRWARHARYFETQTEVAKSGIVRKLRVSPKQVLVLPNSVNSRFVEAGQNMSDAPLRQGLPRIFCLSAAHKHKNLAIIPDVAALLARCHGIECKFILTLPSAEWQPIADASARLGVRHCVENVGPLKLDGCIEQYRVADCLFLPTLAEIFSATYLEAMAMQVPIVTTNLDFAREVCADAGIYYEPLSAEAAAEAIRSVVVDEELRRALIEKGQRRLDDFPDPESKLRMLLDWLVDVAGAERAACVSRMSYQ